MMEMPDTAAAEFSRATHELEGVVRHLVDSRRRDRFMIGAMAGAIMVGAGTVAYVLREQDQQQVQSCRDSNHRFDSLLTILNENVTDEEGRAIVIAMRNVSVVDCDNDGAIEDDI